MVFTRGGDQGTTQLGDRTRVSKADLRVTAYGELDELASYCAWLESELPDDIGISNLQEIQADLFCIEAELARSTVSRDLKARTKSHETDIKNWEQSLPPLRNFVFPGGHRLNAICHICRTTCRRAERSLASLHEQDQLPPEILAYINRLSDWFFVLSRVLSQRLGAQELIWQAN